MTLRRFLRGTVAVLILLALALLVAWVWARPERPDRFYARPAGSVRPGELIRYEPMPALSRGSRQVWRIVYGTRDRTGQPVVASGLVAVQDGDAPRRPVIAWAHGTTGVAPGCAPSILAKPFAGTPAFDAALAAGWAYVATDYVGLGAGEHHAYLVGPEAGRAVLDAVRAARALPGLSLAPDTVIWGHSQGGGAALWAAAQAPVDDPELMVRGVAALAPASDLPALFDDGRATLFGKIVSAYLVTAYDRAYPSAGVTQAVDPTARPVVADIARRCVSGLRTLVSVGQTALLPPDGIFRQAPSTGPLGPLLAANTPDVPIAVPVLIAQGEADDLVSPGLQARWVARRCRDGQAIDYRTYPGRDHMSVVAPASPAATDLLTWTTDRFAGRPVERSCRR